MGDPFRLFPSLGQYPEKMWPPLPIFPVEFVSCHTLSLFSEYSVLEFQAKLIAPASFEGFQTLQVNFSFLQNLYRSLLRIQPQ